MTVYKKTGGVSGAWAKASEIVTGTKCKIVSEAKPEPSQYLNDDGTPKVQNVAKVRFDGEVDPLNVSLNKTTINGLIEAFGEDSAGWQGQILTAETEKVRVGGKANTALYLIPQGYKKIDDESGYAAIVKDEVLETVKLDDDSDGAEVERLNKELSAEQ